MKKSIIAQGALVALLLAGLTAAHAQSDTGRPSGHVAPGQATAPSETASASSTPRKAKSAKGTKSAKKAKPAASNPGTAGGAGNKSGSSRRDGADFDAPRPGAATSKPTGTGWDGYDAR